MPKMKTHRGAHKRVKVTGKGELRRRHAYRSHLLTKKRNSRKRNYTKEFPFHSSDAKNVRRGLRR
ncbi:50S ribosomal protein L35 [Candidatus Saccharibacteria bacterium QS_5_54_17]|nr:MAG: 50S ribosomal protein L35 [Candidatus Saccharibacteria bacterium QS_5_54_17]